MSEFLLSGLLNGLAVGSIYALIALGFALLYKSTKILNLAHGELVLFGGYLAIALAHAVPFPVAVVLTLLAAAVLGFTVERGIMRAPANDQLTASTLGVSLRRVFAYAWAFASIAGAVGGILLGLWLGVNFALGFVGLKALAAVILGGLDSIPGAILGGVTI